MHRDTNTDVSNVTVVCVTAVVALLLWLLFHAPEPEVVVMAESDLPQPAVQDTDWWRKAREAA